MDLPVMPPIKPMLAKATKSMPPQSAHPAGFLYEPKWDGNVSRTRFTFGTAAGDRGKESWLSSEAGSITSIVIFPPRRKVAGSRLLSTRHTA